MIAKILVHPILEVRAQKILEILSENELKRDHPDVLWTEDEKLGMEEAKKVRDFFSLKPYSAKGRAVVVLQAQNLTLDAQNSLLKTLEEPPQEAIILLGAETDKKLLPTVLSRCEVITLNVTSVTLSDSEGYNPLYPSATPQDDKVADIQKLLDASIEERFDYIEKLEEKDAFLNALVDYFHTQLNTNPTPQVANFTKELLQAQEWRDANGNIRAILEYLMLKMPR